MRIRNILFLMKWENVMKWQITPQTISKYIKIRVSPEHTQFTIILFECYFVSHVTAECPSNLFWIIDLHIR